MGKNRSKGKLRKVVIAGITVMALLLTGAGLIILRTANRVQVQFDIHQNLDIIFLSTFAEPPQFAIWLENTETHQLKTVFVTQRAGKGDWEGKTHVPVALPRWFELFRGENNTYTIIEDDKFMAVTGATPKKDFFSVRVEVKPGSNWICWIEVNLAGDYNEAFPEINLETYEEDEFATGQPALLYKTEINAEEGNVYQPVLVAQSTWENGKTTVGPVDSGVTTARKIFDPMEISVIRPVPKLINKNKIAEF